MDTITAESSLPFGKQLAANEKKTRDKAVRSLRQYISTGPALSKLDLLKLWKGLFYCYWMSDKPLIQQQLAQDLGSLVLDIPAANAIPFLEAFWEIHCQQWHGLDRLRLDKFYMLLRRVVFFSFLYLANQDWNEEAVEAYTTMLLEGPMHPTDRKKPDSIRFHIIDIYFEELDKVLELQREQNEEIHLDEDAIVRPLKVTATDNVNKVARKKAKEVLASRYPEEQKQEQEQEQQEEEEEEAVEEDDLETAAEEPLNEPTNKKFKHKKQTGGKVVKGQAVIEEEEKEEEEEEKEEEEKVKTATKKPAKKRKTQAADGNKKSKTKTKKRKL